MFVRGDSDSYVDETMRQVYVRCVNQRRRGHCPPVADQGGYYLVHHSPFIAGRLRLDPLRHFPGGDPA